MLGALATNSRTLARTLLFAPAGQAKPPAASGAGMTAHKEGDPTTLSRLYGRSIGKPLRARQQALVDELLPKIAVPE